jgi:hypothetical protein
MFLARAPVDSELGRDAGHTYGLGNRQIADRFLALAERMPQA